VSVTGRSVLVQFQSRVLALLCSALSACAWFGAGAGSSTHPQPSAATSVPGLRLPQTVKPLAYSLELSVLPAQERFSGRTQIRLQLTEASDHIWLHGKDLHVTEVWARSEGEPVRGVYQQENGEGLSSVHFERELPAGEQLLDVRYDAPFNQQLQGLYHITTEGESYAFTQFESISARLAFPCFDEPAFKTPFDIWLTVASDHKAFSNTRALSEEQLPGLKRIHFAQTKPLPTYLVALAVGPLDAVETSALPETAARPHPVPLRGIATKGKGPMLAHALTTLAPTLAAFENYFQIPYPYDKLDIVAVPDFGPGAMENAGLITFRDSLLLLDKRSADEGQRRMHAFVLAHEVAHQWVGDLVTMHFWEDIWLNEAFATWLSYRIVDELHPELKGAAELTEDMQDAMSNDSRVTVRTIRQPIETSHDIINAFDSITYSKGGGVIGMFERYLGQDGFRRGVQAYLREHAFGNASTEDFLAALSKAAQREIGPAFLSFLTQPGVPLVETELSCAAGQTPQLKLKQRRYLPLGSTGEATQLWQIPICARYEVNGSVRESCTLFSAAEGSMLLDASACPTWVMPNADGAGYYRFTLAREDLVKLRERGYAKLNARERYTLVQSLIAGFEVASVTAADLLESFPKFAEDRERSVALVPLHELSALRGQWLGRASLGVAEHAALAPKFQRFVRTLYAPVAQRLGLYERANESGDDKLLRAEVLAGMCDFAQDDATRAALAKEGRKYLGIGGDGALHPEVLPAELHGLGVRMFVEQGDAAAYDAVFERLKHSTDAIERTHAIVALASVSDARAAKARALTLDPALRVNEVLVPLRVQLSDYRTRTAAYAYFEGHFDELSARVSPSSMGYTPWFAARLCDAGQAARVNKFFESRVERLPGGPRSLGAALEALGLCDALYKAQSPGLDAFFSNL
jgi:cytosol alanyl aminopeptidase